MTRIGRWPPCTTSRPLSFSCSRLPACANSLLGASMSIPPIVASGPLQVLHNIGTLSRKARGFCGVGAARKHQSDTDQRVTNSSTPSTLVRRGSHFGMVAAQLLNAKPALAWHEAHEAPAGPGVAQSAGA